MCIAIRRLRSSRALTFDTVSTFAIIAINLKYVAPVSVTDIELNWRCRLEVLGAVYSPFERYFIQPQH